MQAVAEVLGRLAMSARMWARGSREGSGRAWGLERLWSGVGKVVGSRSSTA